MCFSATASFTTAAVTGALGAVCLSRVQARRDLLLAAMPLVFAAQQGLEGLLWLRMDGGAPSGGGLPLAYLIFARAVWPVFAPMAALLAEPIAARRRLIAPWTLLGVGVATYLLSGLLGHPHSAALAEGHIAYDFENAQAPSYLISLAYLAAISLPLLLSTQASVKVLGAVVLTGSVVAYAFYLQTFQSVWCYFAAAASVVLLAHFQWARRGAALAGRGA